MTAIAIVGAGPAGFYAAEALKLADDRLDIHLYDRQPVPFGLTRFGIAPDHQRLKAPAQVFQRIGSQPGVRFIGDVEVGRDLGLDELRSAYPAVLLTHGAQADEDLPIAGAAPGQVRAARELVSWYNGVPDVPAGEFDLQQENVVVIGNGNVAIDIARLLCRPVGELAATDVSDRALAALANSRVRRVHLIGRRGPVQAKFTTRELRELGELPGVDLRVDQAALQLGAACQTELAHPSAEAAQRNLELMRGWAQRPAGAGAHRELQLHFGLVAEAFEQDAQGQSHLLLRRMRMDGAPFAQSPRPTDEQVRLRCDLVIASIGFRVTSLPGLDLRCAPGLPNDQGRVLGDDGMPLSGLYVAGWAKRGPSGVLGTNRGCAQETVQSILADRSRWRQPPQDAIAHLLARLSGGRMRPVAWEDWLLLDALERQAGSAQGRPRVKFDERAALRDALARAVSGVLPAAAE